MIILEVLAAGLLYIAVREVIREVKYRKKVKVQRLRMARIIVEVHRRKVVVPELAAAIDEVNAQLERGEGDGWYIDALLDRLEEHLGVPCEKT